MRSWANNMTDHTVKAFSEKLEALATSIAQMGGMAEAQLANAIEAIAKRDTHLAENAVGGDKQIDQMQQSVEDQALNLLAPSCSIANRRSVLRKASRAWANNRSRS